MKLICLFILLNFFCVNNCFNIEKYFSDFFELEPIKLEKLALDIISENPLSADITFVSIPWSVLINKKQLGILPDLKFRNAFTICQHIHFKKIIPILKKIGVGVLFTPHADVDEIDGIKIVPMPHIAVNGSLPAEKKDIHYSFIGLQNHKVRKYIFDNIKSTDSVIIKQRKNWHFWEVNKEFQEKEKIEYQDVLSRSRFSLCPRGTGPNTLRLWESLQAGAIPVLISDDMILPKWFDWSSCIIQIKEKDISNLEKTIKSISLENENELRKNCLKAYEKFSGEKLFSVIYMYYFDAL